MTDRPQQNGETSQGWFERPGNVRKLMWALYIGCAASVLLEITLRVGHVGLVGLVFEVLGHRQHLQAIQMGFLDPD